MPKVGFLKPFNFLFSAIFVLSGYLVASGRLIFNKEIVIGVLAALLLTSAANVVNELSYGKLYSMIKGGFSFKSRKKERPHYLITAVLLLVAGFTASNAVSGYTAVLYLFTAFLLAVHIFFSKNIRFLRSVIVGAIASLSILFGASLYGPSNAVYMMSVLILFLNGAKDMVKTMKDDIIDRTAFIMEFMKNFSSYMEFSENKLRSVSAAFLAIFVLLSPLPYAVGLMPFSYFAIITVNALIAFVALFELLKRDKKTADLVKVEFMIKINILVTLIAFLAGSLT